jgi:AcrR family transcriptional regulator
VPKIVDHEERRADLIAATWRVIARLGIDGVTIREIAREAGCSTGSLAHYFRDKDDILRMALEMADARVRDRIAAVPAGLTPVAMLREVLSHSLPLDDDRAFDLSLDVNFWARALNHRHLRALQHSDHDRWRACILGLVEEAIAAGEFTEGLKAEDICDVLVAFVDGIGLQGLVYPELISVDRIERLLDLQLIALGASSLAVRRHRRSRVSTPKNAKGRQRVAGR